MPLISSSASVSLWTYQTVFIGNTTVQNYLATSGIETGFTNTPLASLAALNTFYASYLAVLDSNGLGAEAETLSNAATWAINSTSGGGTGGAFPSAYTIITGTNNGSGNFFPSTVVYSSPYLVATGHTYDTGTVQIYQMDSFVTYANGLTYQNSVLIQYYVIAYCASVVAPSPITLQIEQNTDGTYTPQDLAILTKYSSTPGTYEMRAKFGGTRIGCIVTAVNGGFVLYEETGGSETVLGTPTGIAYVYDNTRAFVISVPVAQMGQYLVNPAILI